MVIIQGINRIGLQSVFPLRNGISRFLLQPKHLAILTVKRTTQWKFLQPLFINLISLLPVFLNGIDISSNLKHLFVCVSPVCKWQNSGSSLLVIACKVKGIGNILQQGKIQWLHFQGTR